MLRRTFLKGLAALSATATPVPAKPAIKTGTLYEVIKTLPEDMQLRLILWRYSENGDPLFAQLAADFSNVTWNTNRQLCEAVYDRRTWI